MATPVSDIVTVIVSSGAPALAQANFNIPLALVPHAVWPERVRFYNSITDVELDFAEGTAAHEIAQAMFAGDGDVRPATIAIGRGTNAVTKILDVTPVAVNNRLYKMNVNGNAVSFQADATATVAEIVAGLKVAIDALSIAGLTTTDNTTKLTITGTANLWYSADSDMSPDLMAMLDVSTIAGSDWSTLSADMDAILLESSNFYGVTTSIGRKEGILALAGWVNGQDNKLGSFGSQDTNCVTLSVGSDSTTSVMGQAKTSGYDSLISFHHRPGQFMAAQWLSAALSYEPGSITLAYFTLPGSDVSNLTGTHQVNARAKNGNFYSAVGGVGSTFDGKLASGKWADNVRDQDYFVTRLQTGVAQLFLDELKVLQTNGGIQKVVARMQAAVDEAKELTILQNETPAVITFPDISEVSALDRTNRVLRGLTITDRFANAFHKTIIEVVISQ